MVQKVHRQDDTRACGATTIVTGQSTVYCNGKLVSVDGDPNTDGAGGLIAKCKEVYINGKKVVIVTNTAVPDMLCPLLDAEHCIPSATGGSPDAYIGE